VKRTFAAIAQVIAYLIAVVMVTIVVMGLTKLFVGDWESGGARMKLFGDGFLTVLGIAITNLLAFLLLRSKAAVRGWPGLKVCLVWFAKGGICGLFMAGLMVLLTIAFGGATLAFEHGELARYLRYTIPLAGCLLIAALGEEWLFRGFPLTKLAGVLGPGWANLLMSLLFAAAHLGAAGSNVLALVNIVIGSAVAGSLRFTPGGISTAWGFHFAWNCTQVLAGAGLSVEGLDVPGVAFSQSGPEMVSGGAFGPEAGIGATLSTLLVLLFLFGFFRRRGMADLPLPLRMKNGSRQGRPGWTVS